MVSLNWIFSIANILAFVSALEVAEVQVSTDGSSDISLRNALIACKQDLYELIDRTNSNPIMVRLAWHDSGTYDHASTQPWPKKGGANGSIRFMPEIGHGANAGLHNAITLLTPLKEKYPMISWADLFQMASAVGIEHAGGPKIPMKYGRVDVILPSDCAPEGNLPDGNAPFHDGTANAPDHLRKVFHRMGLNDQEIVALSGAHTIGRAHKDRSGAGVQQTKFTAADNVIRSDGTPGIGRTTGGSSWTSNWLTFDNSYFKIMKNKESDPELLKLQTDIALFEDDKFRSYAEKYAMNQEEFFNDYALAHKKLSELGSKFSPEEGITI
eukprot:gene11820-24776_t